MFDWFLQWASTFVVWHLSVAAVAKTVAVLVSVTGVIQAIKKGLEAIGKWEWVLKFVPWLGVVVNFLAHGWGPVILASLLTAFPILIAGVQDGALTLGEIINAGIAFFGSQGLYKFIREYIFPKKETVPVV